MIERLIESFQKKERFQKKSKSYSKISLSIENNKLQLILNHLFFFTLQYITHWSSPPTEMTL